MKKYYYFTDATGKKRRYIHFFKQTDATNCSMCEGMKRFITEIYPTEKHEIPARILNLCKANLARHLKTGKHWKSVGEEWK
jgi:hypothetical protein